MSEPIPLLNLRLQYEEIKNEIEPLLLSICESQQFILGAEVERFEKEISSYCQSEFATGVSSGTDAILLALMALDIGPGDEVITSPYSFFATVGSIVRLGATPVFVDIERDSYNIDARAIEERITPRTKAIMPVHLYGQCAEMDNICSIAKHHQIAVVEDAAQAIGAEYKGRRAGALGDLGCFSFFPSKNLGAFGDAGLVTTNSSELQKRVKRLRVHGSDVKYYHDEVGGNFRIDALQAAVLRVKLRYLDGWTTRRQMNAELYRRLFSASGVAEEIVALPIELPNRRHIYNQFVVRSPRREVIMKHLKERQIGCEIYYPLPLHLQKCFAQFSGKVGDFPVSEEAAEQSLALPIFGELTEAQITRVVEEIVEAVRQ